MRPKDDWATHKKVKFLKNQNIKGQIIGNSREILLVPHTFWNKPRQHRWQNSYGVYLLSFTSEPGIWKLVLRLDFPSGYLSHHWECTFLKEVPEPRAGLMFFASLPGQLLYSESQHIVKAQQKAEKSHFSERLNPSVKPSGESK